MGIRPGKWVRGRSGAYFSGNNVPKEVDDENLKTWMVSKYLSN